MSQTQIFAGRYRLDKKIGSGGYSEVWLAKDEMAGDTEVAIKIYAPDKGLDQNGIKQFSREYTITAQLQHNNLLIARHYDIHDGSPYLIMPYCSRGSLQGELYEKGSLPEEEIFKIIKDVAEGLHYLHNKDILHQDIKPDNVLIYDDGRYMLTDFGISTRMRSTLKKATSTKSALTLAYAPPERYSENPENTKSGDIFSLGVMLYELATGDVPWDGNGGMVLLTGAQIPKIPNSYSNELRNLVFACMSKAKEDRPAAEDLLKFVKGNSIATPKIESKKEPNTTESSGRKTVFYEPEMTNSGSNKKINKPIKEEKSSSNSYAFFIIIFLICIIIISYKLAEPNQVIPEITVEEALPAEETVVQVEEFVPVEETIVEEAPDNFSLASKYIREARSSYDNNNYNSAISSLEKAIDLYPSYENNGYYHWLRGACFFGIESYNSAVFDFTKAINIEPDKYNYSRRAESYYFLKKYENAIRDFTQAINLSSGKEQASYYNYRGVCYSYLSNFQMAKADYKKAVNNDPNNEQYKKNFAGLNNYSFPYYAKLTVSCVMFSEPTYSSRKINDLRINTNVEVISESGAYYKIKYYSQTGYINKYGVEKI